MAKKILTQDDIVELYDKLTTQSSEDRVVVNELYKELHDYVTESPLHMVDVGEHLTKIVDLKIKQTGQLLEIIKIIQKSISDADDLSPLSEEDMMYIDAQVKTKNVA